MLAIAIVGLPNVGKSTLFKALTNVGVNIENYPFTTIDPNIGTVKVPDERVDKLAEFSKSKKKVYTTIEFIDIAGLVKGASHGEGLGNKFLANIREADAIAQVVRAFDDANITHVHNRVDPTHDMGIINTELILADLDTVSKRIEKTVKLARAGDPSTGSGQAKQAIAELAMLEKFKKELEAGTLINQFIKVPAEFALAKELNLLTSKRTIYVFNISEKQLKEGWQPDEQLISAMSLLSAPGSETHWVTLCNTFELLLSESSPEEEQVYLEELGMKKSGLDTLIERSYYTLDLITFLTTGEDETRAWTAHIGDPIPKASRAIHTDFEKLFIRADVINWQILLTAGSYATARDKGLLRTVGRDYVIQEGDVVEIKIGA